MEGQGRPARAMGISVSLLGMALQSRPAYACSCIPAAIHHPDHVDPSITDTLSLLVGVETRRHHHHPSHAIALLWKCCGSGLLVLSLNYSDPSPRHQRTITPTSLSHRTHTRTRAQEKRFRSPLRRKASTPHPRMPPCSLAPENLPTSTAT